MYILKIYRFLKIRRIRENISFTGTT